MPRIPQLPTSKESHIGDFKISTPRAANINAPSGRPARNAGGVGGRVIGGAVKELSAVLRKMSQEYSKKEELTRIANSQKLQFEMNEKFRIRKKEEAEKVGSQALGLVEKFKQDTEDLREGYIPEDLDQRTSNELNQHFNSQYNSHASWLVNHSIRQSSVADSEARIRAIQDAHTNITSMGVGDRVGIEREVMNTLKFEKARHPGITEDQMETNGRSLREDYLTFALTKWAADSTIGASNFWEKNQEYIKSALPKNYNVMAKKMEIVEDDSTYDIALGTLERMFGEDDAAAAKFVDEDTDGLLKLTPSQRLKMSSTLWANNNHKLAEEERIKNKKEEEYLINSHNRFFDPETRTLNTPAALSDLEQTYRSGGVDSAMYESRRKQLLTGGEFSNSQAQDLIRDINSVAVTTKGEVLNRIAGTSANPAPFFSELKKRQDQISRGFTSNWFDVAYDKFNALASIKKKKDLPSDVKEKELLVSTTELPAFKKRLEEVARWAGLSAGDPEIVNLANTLLESGWYSDKHPSWHSGGAAWNVFGEKYQRLWEFPEGEVMEVLQSRGLETATGGSPTLFQKYTPEEEEAVARLHTMNIPIDSTSIKRALEIIKIEKGGE